MKIILKEDVANLGYKDDVVEVKNGYGRNYLIPNGKAILATTTALKNHEESLRQRAHKIAKEKADAEALAATFQGVSLTIPAKVSATGTIYGSVGAQQITDALIQAGHPVERKAVKVLETVKTLGSYTAELRFHKEVAVEIPFTVIAEGKQEEAAPAEEEAAPAIEEAPVQEEAAPAEEETPEA